MVQAGLRSALHDISDSEREKHTCRASLFKDSSERRLPSSRGSIAERGKSHCPPSTVVAAGSIQGALAACQALCQALSFKNSCNKSMRQSCYQPVTDAGTEANNSLGTTQLLRGRARIEPTVLHHFVMCLKLLILSAPVLLPLRDGPQRLQALVRWRN